MIPFSPPHIDEETIQAVSEVLRSGWITTGPKTKLFEKEIARYCGIENVLCLNSATAGLEIILRWFGVTEGDEVIVPAYTYSATANVVVHCGATPVLVDSGPDFNLDPEEVRKKITPKTKVIMPVDFGGMPCNYNRLHEIIISSAPLFTAANDIQSNLGRILVLSDAAHSFGATYHQKRTGSLTDITVFSFHAVKNLTTAEGGAVCFNLPQPFNNQKVYQELCVKTLHGQNKDALAKTQPGNWRYDIVEAGYKMNMTDIQAAIGLGQLKKYDSHFLTRRKAIVDQYMAVLTPYDWFEEPIFQTDHSESSYHLFPVRIKSINETERDLIIQRMFESGIAVNVHFIPLPMHSFYKKAGFNISNFPVALQTYQREITLPLYPDLTDEHVHLITHTLIHHVQNILAK